MFQHLLVPVDGSRASFYALDQALLIAKHGKAARVDVLCIIDVRLLDEARLYLPADEGVTVSSELAASFNLLPVYQQWAERVTEKARARGEEVGVPVRVQVLIGLPHQVIIDASPEYDLLVLGPWELASDYPGPFLAGSTWRQVVAHTRPPLLIVRGPAREIHSVLVAYDGSPQARDALQLAATWTQAWDLKLVVLAVHQDGDRAQALLWEARNRAAPAVPRLIARDGDPIQVLVTVAADEQHCDLIAIGAQGRNGVLERLRKSAMDAVVRRSPLPVLLSH